MWTDISTYSREDKERVPNAWEFRLPGRTRIVIVRAHRRDPDHFVLTFEPWFSTSPIGPADMAVEEAKRRALFAVEARLRLSAEAVRKALAA